MTLTRMLQNERPNMGSFSAKRCLEEALAIGERMVDDAFVERDRCTWITRKIVYPSGVEPKDRPTVQPMTAGVYDGTAGAALMLARLYSIDQRPSFRKRALQAFNQSVKNDWSQEDPQRRYGFFSGLTGLAWTAHELSARFDEPTLLDTRDRILAELDTHGDYGFPDIMFGAASAAPALCRIHQDDPSAEIALALAEKLAQDTLRRTEWNGDAASWDGARSHGACAVNLTGFSHGTSGIAWGLMEYGRYVQDDEAIRAAEGALRYEEETFDTEAMNWLDLRNDFRPNEPIPRRFASVWCHGAPGIGISRLAFSSPTHRSAAIEEDLQNAVERTRENLARTWLNPGGDTSACHGVTGNAEALSLMEDALGMAGMKTLREWAGWLVYRYGSKQGIDWPSAVTVGQYPALMTGAAAVAHFLIRATDPSALEPLVLPPHPRR